MKDVLKIILSVLGTIIFMCATFLMGWYSMYHPKNESIEIPLLILAFLLGILYWLVLILAGGILVSVFKGLLGMFK
jgi:hypothetical protein